MAQPCSGSSNRKLSATMKPDLDGRTVLGLQPRHKALSETNRDNSSDYDILGPDPLGAWPCIPYSCVNVFFVSRKCRSSTVVACVAGRMRGGQATAARHVRRSRRSRPAAMPHERTVIPHASDARGARRGVPRAAAHNAQRRARVVALSLTRTSHHNQEPTTM